MRFQRITLVMILTLGAALSAYGADATGKWSGEYETPRGTTQVTFDLKADGETLTGKVITSGGESEIQDGKVSGDEVSFVRLLSFQDREIRINYKGKVSDDEIQFTATVGDRPPMEFVTKRVK